MDEITINLLNKNDVKELLEFERRNRNFFEKTCLSRGDSYYEYDNFKSRVNELVDIVRGNFNKAEVGYRIDEECIGMGYAEKAVNSLKKLLYTNAMFGIFILLTALLKSVYNSSKKTSPLNLVQRD